jgi:hypothetical protein
MVQILWNLTGGIFVFRGGYHQPTEAEAAEMEQDEGNGQTAVREAPNFKHQIPNKPQAPTLKKPNAPLGDVPV